MNIEALMAIGIFTVFLGGILFLPLLIWKKWKGDKAFPASGSLSTRINQRGILFYGVMVVFLFVGLGQEHIAPQSGFGQLVSSWPGRLAYIICVLIMSEIIEYALALRGIKFSDRNDDDV